MTALINRGGRTCRDGEINHIKANTTEPHKRLQSKITFIIGTKRIQAGIDRHFRNHGGGSGQNYIHIRKIITLRDMDTTNAGHAQCIGLRVCQNVFLVSLKKFAV